MGEQKIPNILCYFFFSYISYSRFPAYSKHQYSAGDRIRDVSCEIQDAFTSEQEVSMDNVALRLNEEELAVSTEDDKYYYVCGLRFEKGRKYTYEDYLNTPEDARLELIDGVFYELYPEDPITGMAAPVRAHQELVGELYFRIRSYIGEKGGSCKVYPAPFGVKLNENDKSTVEPDITVVCDPSKLNEYGCTGAPDWIIEVVSPGSPGNDYVRKLNKYLEAGVREYWIVDPTGKLVSVYEFEKGSTLPKEYTFDDKVKVGIYEDLYIDFSGIKL
jgi:Uma2 family endonuclease